MIIEVSLNNNYTVRVRCWLITCGRVLCKKIHVKIKVPFNFHQTSNKLPLCPGRLFVSEPGICRQFAPLPPRLRLRPYRRFRARRPGGRCESWGASEHHSLVTSDTRHPGWGWVAWVRPGSRHAASTSAWCSSPVWSSWQASPSSGSSTASSSVWSVSPSCQ